ncbi:diacylglycerol kinase family lipid kinase [Pontiellaceae bacterium B12219]|nr:diacylglycerol kinase family lipid kinase [Pontiellaceae bacterium B12219]
MSNTHYIINPAANGGAGLRVWAEFKRAWAEEIDSASVSFTEHAGHARQIAAQCMGYDTIAVAGGDGTISEVISGIMERPDAKPRLAIIPCGTGNDIGRTAGVSSIAQAIAALRGRAEKSFDLIRVVNATETRHAFLFANAGFCAIPMMKPWMKRLFGATGAYYLSTLLQAFIFKPTEMVICVDGKEYHGRTFLVMAGNSEFAAGGSMRIAPGARTDDGKLNISIIRSVSIFKLITKLFSSIAKGTYINEPEVSYFTGNFIRISSVPPVPLDLDGELFGTTPAAFSICPAALNILTRG